MTTKDAVLELQRALNNNQHEKLALDGDPGPITIAAIKRYREPVPVSKPPIAALPINDLVAWMTWAKAHLGEHEVLGSKDNPFIMSLYPDGNYPQQHDEVPWCACFVNAALKRNGYKGSNSAAAKSFDKYGTACEPKYGAIITLRHANGGRHVTFFSHWVNEAAGLAACLGGNQANSVKVSTYNFKKELVASRWPVKS